MKITRNQRYLLTLVIFFVVWSGAYLWYQQTANDEVPSDSVETLLKNAEQVSAQDATIVGDLSRLDGRILFLEQRAQPNYRIAEIDFADGELDTLFHIPQGGLVYQIADIPDSNDLLLTYSPPPEADQTPYDRNGIYTLNTVTGDLTHLLGGDESDIYYAYQQASTNAIFYTTYSRQDSIRRIERYDRDTGDTILIADSATYPQLSPDGQHITYIGLNPTNGNRSLWIASATDGDDKRELITEGTYPDIDLPMFTADGESIYFTILEPVEEANRTLFDLLMGAHRVRAHGNHVVPALWYQISVETGDVEQITRVPTITLFSDHHEDIIGFVTATGFYIVDGTGVQPIVQSRAIRSFVWVD